MWRPSRCFSVPAADRRRNPPWQTAYRETGQYLLSQPAPTTGSIGGEWAVIGLRRAGLLTDEMARSYKAAAEDYVRQAGSPRLHRAKSTDTSRTILGLTAAGYDATAVAGIDLTAGLSDMSYLRIQGLNGPIWALIGTGLRRLRHPAGGGGRGADHP